MTRTDFNALGKIVEEYIHACPHCTSNSPEWVVSEEDVFTIVQRTVSEALQ